MGGGEDDAFYLFVFGGRGESWRDAHSSHCDVNVGRHLRSTRKTTERVFQHGSTGRTSHKDEIIQNKYTIGY